MKIQLVTSNEKLVMWYLGKAKFISKWMIVREEAVHQTLSKTQLCSRFLQEQ